MENISLFKIQQEFIDLCGQISEGSGELTPELEEKLKINAENFTEKTVNYHLFMKEIKMKIEQGKILKQEIDAKIKSFEKVFEKCENNVKRAMLLYEKETAGDDYHKFSLRKSVSVEIENENIIEYSNFAKNFTSFYKDIIYTNRYDAINKINGYKIFIKRFPYMPLVNPILLNVNEEFINKEFVY